MNFNDDVIDWNYASEEEFLEKLEKYKERVLSIVNSNVNKTSKISKIEVFKEPFEKTATKKIRRFKYAEEKGI